MKKFRLYSCSGRGEKRKKMVVALLAALTLIPPSGFSQPEPSSARVSLELQNTTLEKALKELSSASGYYLIYDVKDVRPVGGITLHVVDGTIENVLDNMLADRGFSYVIEEKTIMVRKLRPDEQTPRTVTVKGMVTDKSGKPIPGVNVVIKDIPGGTSTDQQGRFTITVPNADAVLVFSFIGMETRQIPVSGISQRQLADGITVVMNEAALDIDAVVISTGIYTREQESFTGSAATYDVVDLKNTGSRNVLEGLKTLDPSFAIIEDNEFGSDPNRLPNMEIRGKSSMLGIRDQVELDPNQPLFILDGFESSVQAIMDLDINRVASITILKDAASTAIYGSKAANGVVVVETVEPKAGELRVSYNGSLNISMPDLSSYNLMNSSEKLQFDKLSGRFTANSVEDDIKYSQIYSEKLAAVASGVDTYWLAEPLRVGINHKHSLYVEGGEKNLRFGLGAGYNGNSGVMKESLRQVMSANLDLIYRVSKFQFSNKFSVSNTRMTNPIVPFQTYADASPFYKKRGEEGVIGKWLENNQYFRAPNPLWNASLNSRDTGNDLYLSDFLVAEYMPSEAWKLRARFGVTYGNNDSEQFYSRDDTRYEEREEIRKGEFHTINTRLNRIEGEFTATWAKLIGRHQINLVAGANIYSSSTLSQGYSVEGFPAGDFSYPSFSNGFPENGMPVYEELVSRSINGYLNAGYVFDDRYLMDVSLRTSGSSAFGSSKRYDTVWSVGLGWNIHREKFIAENAPWINLLKLRASIGNPGNQSFNSAQTLLTYAFQYGSLNYFGLGALLSQIGNPNLDWQTTVDKNIGIDITLFDRRLSITADYYHKLTDPLLININMAESTGVRSYLTNAGEQMSTGLTLQATYQIIRNTDRRIYWSVRGNLRTQRIRIDKIGNKLSALNSTGRGVNTVRYYDGSDPDDIWAIISEGIDPSNGKELFRTPDGGYTYDFTYDHEVKCGNKRPKIEGIVGSQFTWGGFTVNLNFRYQAGADVFNSALFNKVENISASQLNLNQDRRALYERWQKPGDMVRFKDIASAASTPISSRFVQRENVFTLESLMFSYEFMEGWVQRAGLSNLRLFLSMRDVFRISSIRSERGISYPFARTLETGLSFNF